jgi:hypothetical protein
LAKRLTRFTVESLGLAASSVTALPELSRFWGFVAPDWTKSIELTNEWRTDVTTSKLTLAEDRKGYRSRPVRLQKVYFNELSQRKYAELQFWRLRLGQHRNPVPLFVDASALTTALTVGSTAVKCDVTERRFYPGQRVCLVQASFADFPSGDRLKTAIIDTVDSDGLTLVAGLAEPLAVADLVFPMMDCHPVLKSTGDTHTRHYGSADITFQEISGPSALPAAWKGPFDSEFTLYDDLSLPQGQVPIVNLRADWSRKTKVDVIRAGKVDSKGYGSSVSLDGDRPIFRFVQSPTALNRKEAFDQLRLFDSLKGRQHTCYFVNPMDLWAPTVNPVAGTDYVDVEPFGFFQDITKFLTHIALVLEDGEVHLGKIREAKQQTGTSWRISMFDAWPGFSAAVERVTSAHLVRNEKDVLKQTWVTDGGVVLSDMNFTEVLNERAV